MTASTAPMTMEQARDLVIRAINRAITRASEKSRVALRLVGDVSIYADVRDGREPRGLPSHGEHALNRLGQELDRERAHLVIVFEVDGTINGVDQGNVRIWIEESRPSLPTLFAGTAAARRVLYDLATRVPEYLWRSEAMVLDVAWSEHLRDLSKRIGEREAYLAALQAKITESLGE
jgi:hypothetical protein